MPELPRVVCLPTLGFYGLWRIRRQFGRGTVVQFHIYSQFLKVFLRWLRVPGAAVMGALSRLFGLRVERLAPEGRSGSTPAVTFWAMTRSTALTEALSAEIERTGWAKLLGTLVGPREAGALFHRRFPWHAVFLQLVAVGGSRASNQGELPIFWSPEWPQEWALVAERTLSDQQLRFLAWPHWYQVLIQGCVTTAWVCRSLLALVAAVLRPGRTAPLERARTQLMIGLIEEGRMGGTPIDSNYLGESSRLRRQDSLYFMTREQERARRNSGSDPGQEIAHLRAKGFRIERTGDLRYSKPSRRELFLFARGLLGHATRMGPACLAQSFWRGLAAYLEYRLLLDHYAPANAVHTASPNGDAAGRLDSAILTGLCRREGVRCVGYQNRILYGPVYEDCFDCYDTYLAWGRGWTSALGNGFRFVDQVIEVGCPNNDAEVSSEVHARAITGPVVTVFTFEWNGNLSPPATTLRFLTACAKIAALHPEWYFQIKTKDPEMVPLIREDAAFRFVADRITNFAFLNLPRHETAKVIRQSDIVIATAFTSPGADALLQKKRVIFYSEVMGGGWGAPFADLPDLVANGAVELQRLFELARADYREYARTHASALRALDPFGDGRSRVRMIDFLLGDAASGVSKGSPIEFDALRAIDRVTGS